MDTTPTITDNDREHRFEARVGDELVGYTVYEPPGQGDEYVFVHTEVDPRFEGRGLASALVGQALDALRERGATVLPFCPFVRGFIDRHRGYLDLVPGEARDRFGLTAAPRPPGP
jgi:uncharacterized protein